MPLDQIIADNFPQTGVALSFGYGSKVVKQGERNDSSDLIDLIFVVDDPLKWHQENLNRNNQHYSFLRYLPNNAQTLTKIQENFGAGVYFNPFVSVGDLSVKYGIIKTSHLIEDLSTWNKLYIAGRLQKPVQSIVNTCDRNESLRSAMRFNKESAIRAALLQLPETFDCLLLYKTITQLSYNGDLRMIFGEDKNKVDNIVSSQVDRFNQIYIPLIKLNQTFKEYVQWSENKQIFTQDLSTSTTFKNLRLLPRNVRSAICESYTNEARTRDVDAVLASVSKSINSDIIVTKAIASIVRRSSTAQSVKGLITAGLLKSIKYSQRKILKSIISRINWT